MRFLLVDKIYELDPGKRIKASKRLDAGEEIFRDHFPGFPVVPGVLLTEMMAQAAGKCLDAEKTHPGRAMLGKIHSAEFRSWVRPGDESVIHAQISKNQPQYATAQCFIEVSGRRVCSAELFFAFHPHTQFAAGYRDPVLEDFLQSHAAVEVGAAEVE
jgi:3-hydroxyacyl-[acyl-carrier-protein] dehydratase